MNKFKEARKSIGISTIKIAKATGISLRQIQRYDSGEAAIPIGNALLVAKAINCDPKNIIDDETLKSMDDSILDNNIVSGISNITIPYYEQKASAGNGIFGINDSKYPMILDKQWLEQEFLLRDFKDLFAMLAHGDSMEPDIKSGDTLVCKECSTFNEGTYIVSYLNDIFMKKVQRINKQQIKLISSNKKYEDRIINLEELDEFDFRIIGKVLLNIRKYNL